MSNNTEPPMELFKKAFAEDDAVLFARLLEQHPEMKAKINEPVAAFDAPVITRVRSREMLDVLLKAGADINAKSRWWAGGFGLLHGAEPDLATYAIERGAVLDVHAAARLGLMGKLRELISPNPALVHARGGDGQAPLHFASTVEIAEYLLDHGADIDARDIDHESTPAQYMVRDRQEIARYLVRRGCGTDILMAAALGDIDLVRQHLDSDPACIRMSVSEQYFPKTDPRSGGTIYIWTLGQNKTAHVIAGEFGREDIFRLLMERSPEELKLAQACELGDEATVKALLASRPNLIQSLPGDDRRSSPTPLRTTILKLSGSCSQLAGQSTCAGSTAELRYIGRRFMGMRKWLKSFCAATHRWSGPTATSTPHLLDGPFTAPSTGGIVEREITSLRSKHYLKQGRNLLKRSKAPRQ